MLKKDPLKCGDLLQPLHQRAKDHLIPAIQAPPKRLSHPSRNHPDDGRRAARAVCVSAGAEPLKPTPRKLLLRVAPNDAKPFLRIQTASARSHARIFLLGAACSLQRRDINPIAHDFQVPQHVLALVQSVVGCGVPQGHLSGEEALALYKQKTPQQTSSHPALVGTHKCCGGADGVWGRRCSPQQENQSAVSRMAWALPSELTCLAGGVIAPSPPHLVVLDRDECVLVQGRGTEFRQILRRDSAGGVSQQPHAECLN